MCIMRKSNLFVLLAALFVLSCSDEEIASEYQEENVEGMEEPVQKETDVYSITYQYQEDVQVLTPGKISYIERVEEDSILYFSKNTPVEVMPKKGDILSCGQNDKLPYGLGGSVVSVTDVGDTYRCVTTSAPLDQIFEVLEFSYTQALTDTIDGFYDEDGNFHETEVVPYADLEYVDNDGASTRASIGSPNVLQIQLSTGSSGTGAGLYSTGVLSLGAISTVDFSLSKRTYECSLELLGGISATVGVRAGFEGYKKLWEKKNLVQGVANIGPVVLRPYLDVEAGLQAAIEGSISTSVAKQVGFKFGFKRDGVTDGFFTENTTQEASNNLIKNIEVDAKGDLGIVAKLNFGAGIYTRSVAIGLDPEVSFKGTTDFKLREKNLFRNESTLDFNLAASLNAFFVVELFGHEFVHQQSSLATWNLWEWSYPLLPKLADNSLYVNERTGATELLFDAGFGLSDKGVLANFVDITPAIRIYEGEDEKLFVPHEEYITIIGGRNEFDFLLAGLEPDTEYKAVPCIMFSGNIYEEDGITFSSSFPVEVRDVGVRKASYYPNYFEFAGRNYSFKYDCAVTTALSGNNNNEDIADWGYYYEDEYGQRVAVSLSGNTSPYEDTRFAYCKNEATAIALFGGYVRYVGEEQPSFSKPQPFQVVYPANSAIELTDCVFQGTESDVTFQNKTYDYKSTYKFYFNAEGAYWLTVSPDVEGSGWNGWNLPDYSVRPVDGANVLTVNYYYDEKDFSGEYRVYLLGQDGTHGTSCRSNGYVSYSHNSSHFDGCTLHGAGTRGVFPLQKNKMNELEINLVKPE